MSWVPVRRTGFSALLLVACERPGAGPDVPKETDTSKDSAVEDTGLPTEAPLRTVDVLIVGAGAAGLSAAALLTDAGLDSLVVELDSQLGGAALYTGGWMTFSGTSEQQAAGIEDSPELLLSEWAEMTGGDSADPWVQLFATRNVEVHDWLIERGLSLALASLPSDGASVRRIHMTDGEGGALISAIRADGDEAMIWTNTLCTELVIDRSGQVQGAWVERDIGNGWIQAENVLVATGGFLRDLEQVAWARPELDTDALWFATGPHAEGSGHRMLEDVGAAWDNPAALSIYGHGIADPRTDGEELSLIALKPLARFNRSGARFTSESPDASYSQGQDLVAQDGQMGWFVFDSRTYNHLLLSDPMVLENEGELPTLESLEALGQMQRADSLGALATGLGMDESGLQTSVDELNRVLDTGSDDPFWGEAPEMDSISEPPFYGVQVVPALAKAFGGIDVDTSGRVLDTSGEPIMGLYAAGELTGMAGGSLVGDGYFTGSLSAVILSGWVVAESLINPAP